MKTRIAVALFLMATVTLAARPPAPPIFLSAEIGVHPDGRPIVSLFWVPAEGTPFDAAFTIYRYENAKRGRPKNAGPGSLAEGVIFVDESVQAGHTYLYEVRTFVGGQESRQSAYVEVAIP